MYVRPQEFLGQVIIAPSDNGKNLVVLILGLIRDAGHVGAHELITGQTGGNGIMKANDPMVPCRLNQPDMKVGKRVLWHRFLLTARWGFAEVRR